MTQSQAQDQNQTFEKAIQDLQTIVERLERGELPLNEALAAFKQGVELSQYCQETLKDAEETIVKMMTDQGEVDFETEGAQ